MQHGVVQKEGDPFPCLRVIRRGAAEEFDAAAGVGHQPGLTEAGDVVPETRFVHSVHKCFHSAPTLRAGVGQLWGDQKILKGFLMAFCALIKEAFQTLSSAAEKCREPPPSSAPANQRGRNLKRHRRIIP